jgi:hypothetical protein
MPAHADKYAAVSNTAMSITGDINFVPGTITFQNGAKIHLVEVKMSQTAKWNPSGDALPGDIYRVDPAANPKLLNGNRLCGAAVAYAVIYFLNPTDLNLNLYSGETAPSGSESDALCATYSYEGE